MQNVPLTTPPSTHLTIVKACLNVSALTGPLSVPCVSTAPTNSSELRPSSQKCGLRTRGGSRAGGEGAPPRPQPLLPLWRGRGEGRRRDCSRAGDEDLQPPRPPLSQGRQEGARRGDRPRTGSAALPPLLPPPLPMGKREGAGRGGRCEAGDAALLPPPGNDSVGSRTAADRAADKTAAGTPPPPQPSSPPRRWRTGVPPRTGTTDPPPPQPASPPRR